VPLLGYLFKTKGRVNNRDELLIFVTPKILREGSAIE
jgi:type IV pilus assembly protein PilQ